MYNPDSKFNYQGIEMTSSRPVSPKEFTHTLKIQAILPFKDGFLTIPSISFKTGEIATLWTREEKELLQSKNIYLDPGRYSSEMSANPERRVTSRIAPSYLTRFGDEYFVLRIQVSGEYYLYVFNPETSQTNVIQLASDEESAVPIDDQHFMVFTRKDEKYHLVVWNRTLDKSVNQFELSKDLFYRLMDSTNKENELLENVINLPNHLLVRTCENLYTFTKSNLLSASQPSLLLDCKESKRALSDHLFRLSDDRVLREDNEFPRPANGKMFVLYEEKNDQPTTTPFMIPVPANGTVMRTMVLPLGHLLMSIYVNKNSIIEVYDCNADAPKLIFSQPEMFDFKAAHLLKNKVLVLTGLIAGQPSIEAWNLHGGSNKISSGNVSSLTQSEPQPKSAPKETFVMHSPIDITILNNGAIVSWISSEPNKFQYMPINLLQDSQLELVEILINDLHYPRALANIIQEYSMFHLPKAVPKMIGNKEEDDQTLTPRL